MTSGHVCHFERYDRRHPLAIARGKTDLRPSDLAEIIGVSTYHIDGIETLHHKPSPRIQELLINALRPHLSSEDFD